MHAPNQSLSLQEAFGRRCCGYRANDRIEFVMDQTAIVEVKLFGNCAAQFMSARSLIALVGNAQQGKGSGRIRFEQSLAQLRSEIVGPKDGLETSHAGAQPVGKRGHCAERIINWTLAELPNESAIFWRRKTLKVNGNVDCKRTDCHAVQKVLSFFGEGLAGVV